MEIETVDVGVTRAQRPRRHFLRRVAAPAQARSRPRAKCQAALHRRGRHCGEHRRPRILGICSGDRFNAYHGFAVGRT